MPEWIFGYLQVVKRSNIALGIDPQVVFLGFYKYLCLVFFFYNTNGVEALCLYICFRKQKHLIFQ